MAKDTTDFNKFWDMIISDIHAKSSEWQNPWASITGVNAIVATRYKEQSFSKNGPHLYGEAPKEESQDYHRILFQNLIGMISKPYYRVDEAQSDPKLFAPQIDRSEIKDTKGYQLFTKKLLNHALEYSREHSGMETKPVLKSLGEFIKKEIGIKEADTPGEHKILKIALAATYIDLQRECQREVDKTPRKKTLENLWKVAELVTMALCSIICTPIAILVGIASYILGSVKLKQNIAIPLLKPIEKVIDNSKDLIQGYPKELRLAVDNTKNLVKALQNEFFDETKKDNTAARDMIFSNNYKNSRAGKLFSYTAKKIKDSQKPSKNEIGI